MRDALQARADQLARFYSEAAAGRPPVLRVTTGLQSLDRRGLLEMGVLTAVGAHTGEGKSMVRAHLAEACARAYPGTNVVLDYSLEDPEEMTLDRILGKVLGESSQDLELLQVAEAVPRLAAAMDSLADWTERVVLDSRLHTTDTLERSLRDRLTPDTKLVLVDYAQMFDREGGEASVERVVARLAGRLADLARAKHIAVVLFSQVRREVLDRGYRCLESARWAAGRAGTGGQLGPEAVSGFRPGAGDLQWSSAIQQRAKRVLHLFRPGRWARKFGISGVADDHLEFIFDKGNKGPDVGLVTVGLNPARAHLYDPRRAGGMAAHNSGATKPGRNAAGMGPGR